MSVNIEVNGVKITLTQEQLAEIDKQRVKKDFDYKDIKTFEDVITYLESISKPKMYSTWIVFFNDENLSERELAFRKLVKINEVLNGDWKPDYSNTDQRKYYPWFKWDTNKGAFVYCSWDCDGGSSRVGARLSYKSSELATYAGTQFQEIYNQFLKP